MGARVYDPATAIPVKKKTPDKPRVLPDAADAANDRPIDESVTLPASVQSELATFKDQFGADAHQMLEKELEGVKESDAIRALTLVNMMLEQRLDDATVDGSANASTAENRADLVDLGGSDEEIREAIQAILKPLNLKKQRQAS